MSSCWTEKEISDMAVVTATGVDWTESGKIRLSLLLAIPRLIGAGSAQGGGEGKLESSAGWVVSEEGESIMDITRSLQKKLPREIYYSHSRVLVIGSKMASRGVIPILDFFERYRQSQLISYVAVSKTTALDILNFQPKFEKLASEVIKSEMSQNLIPSILFIDFVDTIMSEGVEPFAPVLELVKSQANTGNDLTNVSVSGVAVFKKGRMVGKLNDQDTRGVLWVNNQIHKGIITVDIPKSKRKGKVSAELEGVHVSRHVSVRNGKVNVRLVITVKENIYENTSDFNLDNEENVTFIKDQIEAAIKQRIKDSSQKVQGLYNSDIYGFGRSVYRRYPKAWRQQYRERWGQLFPQINPEIVVNGKIIRSGLTNNVIHLEE